MNENVFVHERAICESTGIGAGTRIWAFAHVLPGAVVGRDCNVCDGVFIENDVVVGDRVTIKCGVQLWDAITIEDDVFIGPNATFTNDVFPRSKSYPKEYLRTTVRRGASIGANATILPGIEIGSNAMVGAGSVVTRSVPPNAIVVGNPAHIVDYVDVDRSTKASGTTGGQVQMVGLGGVALHRLPLIHDMRGDLSVGEFERTVPFTPRRYFVVFDVPNRNIRGEHAHRECHQFLVCVKGSCSVMVDDGVQRKEVTLDSPALGLHLPPLIWAVQYKHSFDAVLLVFASEYYDPTDYIRNYNEFLNIRKC